MSSLDVATVSVEPLVKMPPSHCPSGLRARGPALDPTFHAKTL
jgi:hypothetical protein